MSNSYAEITRSIKCTVDGILQLVNNLEQLQDSDNVGILLAHKTVLSKTEELETVLHQALLAQLLELRAALDNKLGVLVELVHSKLL